MTSLTTHRCILRPSCDEDEAFMYSAFTHPSFPKLLPLGQTKSVADVKNWIQRCIDGRNKGTLYGFTIESVDTPRKIGQVTLAKDSQPETWAIAYWIHPSQWGQGYATEAAMKALVFAFDTLGASVVWAGASDWNPASIRTIEKLGMHFKTETRNAYFINDEPISAKRYEIDKQTWYKLVRKKPGGD